MRRYSVMAFKVIPQFDFINGTYCVYVRGTVKFTIPHFELCCMKYSIFLLFKNDVIYKLLFKIFF